MSLQYLRYAADISTVIVAAALAITILKRHPDQVGNRLMALSISLIGLYALSFLVFDLIATELAVQVFLRIGVISILFASILMFFSFQVLLRSSKWLEEKKHTIPTVIIGIVFSILLFYPNLITIIELTPVVNTQLNIFILGGLMLIILILTLYNMFAVYKGGIMKTDNPDLKVRLEYIFGGLSIFLIAVMLVILSNITKNETLGSIFDISALVAIILGLLLMSFGFLKREKDQ